MYTIYTGTGKHMYTNCQTGHKKKKNHENFEYRIAREPLAYHPRKQIYSAPPNWQTTYKKKIMKTLNMGLQGNHLPIMLGGGQILHPIVIKI